MNDINCLKSVLEMEKYISNNYSIFLNEASNDYLYENIFSMLEDSKDMGREIYNFIYNKKIFALEEIEKNRLNQEINALKKMI